jgi:hypothetical protein
MPRASGQPGLGAHDVAMVTTGKGPWHRRGRRRPRGALAGRPTRWRTPRTSARCRSPCPAPRPRPTNRGWVAVAGRPRRVGVAGEGVADQDRVGGLGVQRAPGLERHGDVVELTPALQHERTVHRHAHELALTERIAGPPRPGGRQRGRVGLDPRRGRERGAIGPVGTGPDHRHCLLARSGAGHRCLRRAGARTLRCRRVPATSPPGGGRAPWVSVPGCRTRLPGPLMMTPAA